MKLLTKDLLEQFKKQGDTSRLQPEDIRVICKFFNPSGAGTWYCYEYDPVNEVFMAFVNLGDIVMAECGSVSLNELSSFRNNLGLRIERDLFFSNDKSLKEIMDIVLSGGHV